MLMTIHLLESFVLFFVNAKIPPLWEKFPKNPAFMAFLMIALMVMMKSRLRLLGQLADNLPLILFVPSPDSKRKKTKRQKDQNKEDNKPKTKLKKDRRT